jgi:hypothetical protein
MQHPRRKKVDLGSRQVDTADNKGVDDVTFLPALGLEGILLAEDLAQVG